MSAADDLKARREAAQATLDAHAARRDAQEKERAELDAVEALERAARLGTALAAAEEKHGPVGRKLLVVEPKRADGSIAGAVIVKQPDPMHWSRYRNTIGDKKGIEIEQTQDVLWRPAVVWPPLGEVDALITELPDTKRQINDAVARLCGFRMEDLAGK